MSQGEPNSITIALKLLSFGDRWNAQFTPPTSLPSDLAFTAILTLFVRREKGQKTTWADMFPSHHISDRTRLLYATLMVKQGWVLPPPASGNIAHTEVKISWTTRNAVRALLNSMEQN